MIESVKFVQLNIDVRKIHSYLRKKNNIFIKFLCQNSNKIGFFGQKPLSSRFQTKRTNTMLSKNTLMIALLASTIALTACSESQKESAQEVKDEAMEMAADAKAKTGDMVDSAKEGAVELKDGAVAAYGDAKDGAAAKLDEAKDGAAAKYDDVKAGAADKLDSAKETGAEMKDEAAQKIKDACIKTKEALGQSTEGC